MSTAKEQTVDSQTETIEELRRIIARQQRRIYVCESVFGILEAAGALPDGGGARLAQRIEWLRDNPWPKDNPFA